MDNEIEKKIMNLKEMVFLSQVIFHEDRRTYSQIAGFFDHGHYFAICDNNSCERIRMLMEKL